jgi:hypothetical protein
MDKMLLFCNAPGCTAGPDERMLVRFMLALRISVSQNNKLYINPFSEFFPKWALEILVGTDISSGNCVDTARVVKRRILQEWWRRHDNTVVIQNREVATQIRRLLPEKIDEVHERIVFATGGRGRG